MKKQWFVLFVVVLVASFFTSLAFAERVDLEVNKDGVIREIIDNSWRTLTPEEEEACRTGDEVPTNLIKAGCEKTDFFHCIPVKKYAGVVVCKDGKLQTIEKETTNREKEIRSPRIFFLSCGIFLAFVANVLTRKRLSCVYNNKTDFAGGYVFLCFIVVCAMTLLTAVTIEGIGQFVAIFAAIDAVIAFFVTIAVVDNKRLRYVYWLTYVVYYVSVIVAVFI